MVNLYLLYHMRQVVYIRGAAKWRALTQNQAKFMLLDNYSNHYQILVKTFLRPSK